jgi:general secretion pathway protein A
MFTNHFKMTDQPFAERIPINNILNNDVISQGMARLKYMKLFGEIALITGQTGIGKSTLIKLFLSGLDSNQYLPIYIHFTHVEASSLLKLIVSELGEVPRLTKERVFLQIIDKVKKSNLTTILIIDEAHLLKNDALTDLRLLISSPLEEKPILKIILTGQNSIKNTLKQSIHLDFASRISVYYNLKSFSKTQTSSYIDAQLKSVNASDMIFDPDVKNLIHDYSSGIPRQINNIATACLLNAASQNLQKINTTLLNQTMSELHSF